MDRPSWDEYFMEMAELTAKRSTCMRRHVGAVIVKDRRAIATGYNGAPRGIMHCEDRGGCLRQQLNVPSGQRHELCMALHAEQNAIIQAAAMGNSIEGGTIDGEEIFMLVESSVDSVSLASRVKCAEGMIWRLYHDSLGQQEIPTKIAAGNNGRLNNGDNVFYIVVTSTDATQVSVYSLTIHRSYAASIRFYDGDELLYTDTAYTGYEYTPDYVPEIPGYAFNYWKTADGNKCLPFVPWESVSLYVNKTAKN